LRAHDDFVRFSRIFFWIFRIFSDNYSNVYVHIMYTMYTMYTLCTLYVHIMYGLCTVESLRSNYSNVYVHDSYPEILTFIGMYVLEYI